MSHFNQVKATNTAMKLLRPFLSVALAIAVLAPAVAEAATPSIGVPTKIRRGFFTNLDMGTFFTMGGSGASPSNAQIYVGLGVGYDVYASGDHLLSVGAGFNMGTSAGSCFGDTFADTGNQSPCSDSAVVNPDTNETGWSENWSTTNLEAHALYGYQIAPRLMLTGRILGGMAFLQPNPFPAVDGDSVPVIGGGLGAEYATQFDHFSLGLDIAGKMFLGTDAIGIAIAPRIKYTF